MGMGFHDAVNCAQALGTCLLTESDGHTQGAIVWLGFVVSTSRRRSWYAQVLVRLGACDTTDSTGLCCSTQTPYLHAANPR